MLRVDVNNPRACALAEPLLKALGDETLPEVEVVLGGDGFLLQQVATLGLSRPFLGLNCGTLGFLLNDVAVSVEELATRLRDRRYRVFRFPLLEARLTDEAGQVSRLSALNDITLQRRSGHAARLALQVDGRPVVPALGADGVVVASALGSTAYAFSAGASPLHPLVDALVLAPICPHRPRMSSLVLPATSRVQVEVLQAPWRPVGCSVDGRDQGRVVQVEVGQSAERVALAWFEDHDPTENLFRKVILP